MPNLEKHSQRLSATRGGFSKRMARQVGRNLHPVDMVEFEEADRNFRERAARLHLLKLPASANPEEDEGQGRP